MKVRINNLEFRKYTTTKVKNTLYEIIKYEKNPFYGKDKEYEESFLGNFLSKNGTSFDKSCFICPENCYVIAFIKKNSENWILESVGERLLNLTKEEKEIFFEIYELGMQKLKKNDKT